MHIKGKCHCGNVHLGFFWPEELDLVGRACSCRYCRTYGAVWASSPKAILALPQDFGNKVTKYRFEHKTADFCFCQICGVLCVAIYTHGADVKSVVNIKTLENSGHFLQNLVCTNFSGEEKNERLGRRTRNWSPVRIS